MPSRHTPVSRSSTWSHTVRQQHSISKSRAPPMLVCKYVDDNGSVAMLDTKRSVGVTPEANFREYTSHVPLPSVNKATHSGYETQRRHRQKSKEGGSLTKGHVSTKRK